MGLMECISNIQKVCSENYAGYTWNLNNNQKDDIPTKNY